jgi:NAD(P)-dependent dehydrogenase (short-subunit alcohol dehydrogenase family)
MEKSTRICFNCSIFEKICKPSGLNIAQYTQENTSLKGVVALVTGSSRGIGKAIAVAFAKAGANLAITYNQSADSAQVVSEEIRSLGGNAIVLQLDVSQRESIKRVVEDIIDAFGRIDILVNNAGMLQQKPFLEITDEDWHKIIDVNLKGPFICAQEIYPLMQRQGHGRIINIASSGGQLGGTLAVHYSASKAGIICLTKSLARIGAPNILVNCISPGLIDTDMTQEEIISQEGKEKTRQIPLFRPGSAEEVARVAVFLASDQSSYLTGQTINVNGGLYLG